MDSNGSACLPGTSCYDMALPSESCAGCRLCVVCLEDPAKLVTTVQNSCILLLCVVVQKPSVV